MKFDFSRLRVGALLVAVTLAGFGCHGSSTPTLASTATASQPSAAATIATSSATTAVAGAPQASYADTIARVAPAVVTVTSERRARPAQQFPFMNDPRFRDFFGDRAPQGEGQAPQQRQRGLGSGVVVSQDGYILTNHHVVDGAEQVKVHFTDNRTLTAKVVGTDPASDLAVLKIDATNLAVLPLGNSDQVRVGDVALAIGNPLGLEQTVTAGIISAKGRATGLSDGSFEDFLQTDAPINQGNSGGALINTNGELIGINSQILSPSGGNIGIGFAIPSNMAKNVMDQLIKTGKVRRGILGVVVQPVTSDIAQSLNLKEARGVIVSSVQPGSGAERAGVRAGDVITRFNDQQVADGNSFRNRVATTQPNTEVTLTVVRDGREQQLRATLGELPATASSKGEGDDNNDNTPTGKLGLGVEPLTPEAAAQLRLPRDTQGIVVRDVDPNGPAADAQVREGDVIVSVNRQPVRSAEDLRAAIDRSQGRPALMLVNRGGTNVFLTVTPRG